MTDAPHLDPIDSDASWISAGAVCRAQARYPRPEQRRLLWLLQSLSMEQGDALQAAARELVAMFPDRLLTRTMARVGKPPRGSYCEEDAAKIRDELGACQSVEHGRLGRRLLALSETHWPQTLTKDSIAELFEKRDEPAPPPAERTVAYLVEQCRKLAPPRIAAALRELRIDAEVGCFRDLCGALLAWQAHKEKEAAAAFYVTNVGRQVWETLGWTLETGRPCFIETLEGRGKTAAARAFCAAHRGETRFVSLPGFGCQRDFFCAVAEALGIAYACTRSPNEVRHRLKETLVASGLVLVIDEAHFLLPEPGRKLRPQLLDWLDSLINEGVRIALVATPQFAPRLAELERSAGYNVRQFVRRFAGRWCSLPDATDEADLRGLAERLLPCVGRKGIDLAVGCARMFGRDVSGLCDLVSDARLRAEKSGRATPNFADLRAAYELDRLPVENSLAAAFKRPLRGKKSGVASVPLAAPVPDDSGEAAPALAERLRPARSRTAAPLQLTPARPPAVIEEAV